MGSSPVIQRDLGSKRADVRVMLVDLGDFESIMGAMTGTIGGSASQELVFENLQVISRRWIYH